MNKNILLRCSQLLEKLISWSVCFPFIEMVDPEKDGAPDYLDFVKEPMSLNEVKKRLKEGQYTTIDAFKRDVNLIWENAKTYNGDDTLLFYMAMEAKLWFEKKMKKIEIPSEVEWTEKFQKTTRVLYNMLAHPPKEIDPNGNLEIDYSLDENKNPIIKKEDEENKK